MPGVELEKWGEHGGRCVLFFASGPAELEEERTSSFASIVRRFRGHLYAEAVDLLAGAIGWDGLMFWAECDGPRGSCKTVRGAHWVERIEAHGWDEYWDRYPGKEGHARVSDRWAADCGMHTRIYVRADGAIVFSHDEAGYTGVHVVIPTPEYRGRIKKAYLEMRG